MPDAVDHAPSTPAETPPAPPPLLWLGRIGFGAKGVVLITLGLLAVNGAVRVGDRTAPLPVEERAAVRAIRHAPLGSWLVGALSVGLLCYAAYQGGRAILDPERAGRRAGGLVKRAWFLWLGLLNLVLAASALALAVGLAKQNSGSRGGRMGRPGWTVTDVVATVASSTAARHLLIVLGVVWLGYGTVRAGQAIVGRSERLRGHSTAGQMQRWRRRAVRLNLAGRGAISILLGALLILGGFFNSGHDLRAAYDWYETEIHGQFGRPALILTAVILLGWGTFDLLRMVQPLATMRQRLRQLTPS